ncbi:hypothetical protein BT96DRAFT_1003337 [Gymnopus androsaceus JB14]|uniref:Uncharacterized protein n=1 Tax=Gymnopus androsaceus JB14 TaxID=1447944 RepID=A0A6A4GWA4_9AGAR|nr:hypothetical protein BT96DRAFT_1003337 [Gymnopus androsaceus JB14]
MLEKLAKDAPLEIFFEHIRSSSTRSYVEEATQYLNEQILRGIWRTARFNIEGLPPLPDDLSETSICPLALLRLVLPWLSAALRMRCCKACVPILFSTLKEMLDSFNLDIRLRNTIGSFLYINGTTLRRGAALYHQSSVVMKYQGEFDALESKDEQDAFLERMKDIRANVWR